MKSVNRIEEVINAKTLPPKTRIYTAGNAATPQSLLNQIALDKTIRDIELISVLLLGEIEGLFTQEACQRITHRVIFNSHHTREAVNRGWANYQLLHLSDIPVQMGHYLRPNVVFVSVAGPDRGGNYSLGTTVEALMAAIGAVKRHGGLVIAERNRAMPFVLGTTIPEKAIDYLVDADYPLPVSPVKKPDVRAGKIGAMIAQRYIENGSTLQYGIGEVPEAVTQKILKKGVRDLGIHTELFADGMRTLVENGAVSNRFTRLRNNFSVSSIFLADGQTGYEWLDHNSSIQSRPCDITNNILNIAANPKMVSINSAIGIDLHGNIWADSLQARKIYSGVGGQADFIRGALLSQGGIPIIAIKSTTDKGVSKIMDRCPAGITTTAIAADPVIIVSEYGVFDPRGLSIAEHALGISHLAAPEHRDALLKHIYDNPEFHIQRNVSLRTTPKGFTPYEAVMMSQG